MKFPASAFLAAVLGLASLLLCSCGGSTSSDQVLRGQFKDSYVEGVRFATASQSGVTDGSGTFTYRKGETVTFTLGDAVLGSAPGKDLVTPVDLVPGATDEQNEVVTNIARLLQSLDADGDPANGITIPTTVHAALHSVTVDFSSPGFGNSPAIADLFRKLNDARVFAQKRSLVSKEAAKTHLRFSLRNETTPVEPPGTIQQQLTDTPVYTAHISPLLAFSSQDTPHVIVAGDHLYHFYRQADGWHQETVQETPGSILAFASQLMVDASGFLHFFYLGSSEQLYYATNRPGYWAVEPIAGTGAVDRRGYLHTVSYDSAAKSFTYGNSTSGRWITETFSLPLLGQGSAMAEAVPSFTRLVLDQQGKAHLVFCKTVVDGIEDTTLNYASNSSGQWQVETLHEGYSISPSALDLLVDAQGVPRVAYGYYEVIHGTQLCAGSCDNRDEIDYFSKSGGQWNKITADGRDFPDRVALASDSSGTIYLAVSNMGYPGYLTGTAGTWVRHQFPSEFQVASTFAVALDSSQHLHISHLSQDGLRYGSLVDGVWQIETISAPKRSGEYADLALDAAGALHVTYWDSKRRALSYATNAGGSWATEVVTGEATIGKPTSVAVDPTGKVHAVYIDAATGELKYARRSGGAWSVQTVAQHAYGRPSLAVDGNGIPHVAYVDWTQHMLMYATNPSGTWQVNQVTQVDFRSSYLDLSVNSAGRVGICFQVYRYADDPRMGLWVAQKEAASSTWTSDKIYSGWPEDSYCTIAVDNAGAVHVAYRKSSTFLPSGDQLIYTTKATGSWSEQVVAQGIVGKLSLTLDGGRRPLLTYYDAANGAVNYAYNAGSDWQTRQLVQLNTYSEPDFLAPLAIDVAGNLFSAYYDHTAGDLKVLSIANVSGSSGQQRTPRVPGADKSRWKSY